MYLALYSPFFAVISFYRFLSETYRQEITTAVAGGISLGILFAVYLYSQARRKAEQVLTGTANTLEGHIAALSSEMELQKCSFKAELDTMKNSLLKLQQVEINKLKESIYTEILDSMAALKRVVDEQKRELLAQKDELLAQKVASKGDISRILAWLGTSPYLQNTETTSLRQPVHYLAQRPRHDRGPQRDIYEAAMRKNLETAGL